jgi:error-prone DNA polymerase
VPALPPYAELACRSNCSFLTGASHPEELVARAKALRYAALAITDECSLSGVVRAHAEARRLGMPLIVGAQMRLSPPPSPPSSPPSSPPFSPPFSPPSSPPSPAPGSAAAPAPRLVLLAQTRRGYGNLAQWITVARRRAAKGSTWP